MSKHKYLKQLGDRGALVKLFPSQREQKVEQENPSKF